MKHLDLFSGIGGFALACQWVGIETIGFVEIDKYCQKVLRKHWPNVPIVEDIRDVKKIKEIVANATFPRRQANQIQTRRDSVTGETIRIRTNRNLKSPAILITAGFPCQPFSVAGKRGGKEDDRYLWPQTLTVIKAIKPSWILLENVTGIINLAHDTVLSDLEGAGYATETLIIPACAVNAWHRRDRIWIVANSNEQRCGNQCQQLPTISGSRCNSEGLQTECASWWAVEPELGRVAHGIPHRVDRLKSLGNAIVPQVAYQIIKVIKEGANE